MERLSRALAEVADRSALLPVLPGLTAFLLGLLSDHNFKVVIGGTQAIGDLAEAVGRAMQSQLRYISFGGCGEVGDRGVLCAAAADATVERCRDPSFALHHLA